MPPNTFNPFFILTPNALHLCRGQSNSRALRKRNSLPEILRKRRIQNVDSGRTLSCLRKLSTEWSTRVSMSSGDHRSLLRPILHFTNDHSTGESKKSVLSERSVFVTAISTTRSIPSEARNSPSEARNSKEQEHLHDETHTTASCDAHFALRRRHVAGGQAELRPDLR